MSTTKTKTKTNMGKRWIPAEEHPFEDRYRAGRCVTTLRIFLKVLGWDNWGEPKDAWQRGCIAGYQDRTK